MGKLADLHIHTNYSDSTDSPSQVVEQAMARGLACISITDHDTVEGIKPAVEAACAYDLEVLAGVELSCEVEKKEVHILGYAFDYENPEFSKRLKCMQDTRVERMARMIEKLRGIGIDNITLDEVCALAKSRSVGRPHLATLLMEKGWIKNIQEAFDKYIDENGPAYVPKFKQSPKEAINLIKEFGGVAVLAHPMLTNVDPFIPGFVRDGLGGLEVYYPNASKTNTNFYRGIAQKHKLIATGGSDAHGDSKAYTYVGKTTVDYAQVEKLKWNKATAAKRY